MPSSTSHDLKTRSGGKSDPVLDKARKTVGKTVKDLESDLTELNKGIHSHPELGYEEVYAHKTITEFLDKQGDFKVTRHAHNLDTAFVAESGEGGNLVVFCAEYDALPGIGHGCGHNLIATASVTAFVAAARALKESGKPGRLRLLGTPAEEGGGGKIKLLEAGAFVDPEGSEGQLAVAAIMAHAMSSVPGSKGTAGFRTLASRRFRVSFHGKNAHAAVQPWAGHNALDAAVAAYSTMSMLRQQIHPDERICAVIEDGGVVPNVIPDHSRMAWVVRSTTADAAEALYDRVKNCIEGAALASGCKVEWEGPLLAYKDLRVNTPLCQEYIEEMACIGEHILDKDPVVSSAGTDMGNVSQELPGFHGIFGIPAPPNVPPHHRDFADASATPEAQDAALQAARGMAMLALRVLLVPGLVEKVQADFEENRSDKGSDSERSDA
ncbi:hypothetical protein Sste5346_002294 [Sporothrix stenoceras]|uniref:Peptidase M20 domain-containing protein 2 n=1 Tax=Sporothrix stenoceras TaxID=5173 RepID=A0ABR3ZIT6_9PEZI